MAEVTWIRGHIDPPSEGEYYIILEAQEDIAGFKKGDMEVTTDYFHKDSWWWETIGRDNPTWKVVAWADVLKPSIPDHLIDRVVRYFGFDVKRGAEDGK